MKTVDVDSVVLNGVLNVVQEGEVWEGTMTQLRKSLSSSLTKSEVDLLPRSPSNLRVVLNRVLNRLRVRRVSVKFRRTPDSTRTRLVRFVR